MKKLLTAIKNFFTRVWTKIKTSPKFAGAMIAILTLAVGALSVLAVVLAAKNRRRAGDLPGIDIEQHQHNLEEKINEWQRYLDTTPPPRRRG
jgi:hypothetical protein